MNKMKRNRKNKDIRRGKRKGMFKLVRKIGGENWSEKEEILIKEGGIR